MRAARPDIAISGDFIVGFPGETEADFEETLQIVDGGELRSAYSFKYSPRPGTPAATMEDQIPREVMDERLQRLQARINDAATGVQPRRRSGADTQSCSSGAGRTAGQMIGKSPWLQSVHRRNERGDSGDIVDVDVVAAGPNSLAGAARCSEVGRLMARRDLAAVAANDAGPRPARARVRAAATCSARCSANTTAT